MNTKAPVMKFGQYWNVEADAQRQIIPCLPLYDAGDGFGQSTATKFLYELLAMLNAGICAAKDHRHVQQKLWEVDPLLVLRWDFFEQKFAIDRYAPGLGHHITIFYWSHTLGEGGAISAVLRASDMQRADSPERYHQCKQELVDAALKRKEQERAESALAAVDKLSEARIRNFLAVERALQVGEKINVRGEDAKWLQRQYDRTKAGLIPALPGDNMAINPGMHPFKHRRMSRKGGYHYDKSTGNFND